MTAGLEALVHRFEDDPQLREARSRLRASSEAITRWQLEMARTPARGARAPARARRVLEAFTAAGLDEVGQDAAGNVLGTLPGTAGTQRNGAVIVSAHLDTVFPDLEAPPVERDGHLLRGPGAADDAAGLAALVYLATALRQAGVQPERDVRFVATVGEEGEGDLAGVKHLFARDDARERIAAFLTLDLGGHRTVANRGLGSRRLRVEVCGPGGHSWGDFGRPNPIHALARGVARFVDAAPAPREPMWRGEASCSYSVGVLEAGHSVNALPESASARIDLRAATPKVLRDLEDLLRRCLEEGVAAERAWAREGALEVEIRVIGDRPVGAPDAAARLVDLFRAAFAARGITLQTGVASTDANVPLALGVPALALPHGARTRGAHSMAEWCDVRGREEVLDAVLLGVMAAATRACPLRGER